MKKIITEKEIQVKLKKAFDVIGSEAVLPSKILEDVFGIRHDNIIRKIEKEAENLEKVTSKLSLSFFKESTYHKKGKDHKQYLLTEQGFMFMAMSFNNITGSMYRAIITKLFYAMKETIIRNKLTVEFNSKYPIVIEARKQGKETRKNLTDTIRDKIIVARIKGGKTKHQHIYKHYSDLVNKIIGVEIPKCVETRNLLDKDTLSKVNDLEAKISNKIIKLMDSGTKFDAVYQLIKNEIKG